MELKHLTTFLAVARHLSFTRAAQELGYVQSSVTAQIKALEKDLGTRLFERLGRRVTLTEAGRELRGHARRMLAYADEARDAVRGAGDPAQVRGTLHIAAPETLCAYRLPPVLRALQDRFPRLRVVFGPDSRTTLLANLRDGALDAGFLLEESVRDPVAHAERLTDEPMALIAHSGHPLARRTRVRTADLATQTLLLMDHTCAQRDLMDRELRSAGVRPAVMEFLSVEALKRCAAAGLGVALLPAVAVADEVARGEVAVLPWTCRPALGVHLVRHKDRSPTAALTALAGIAREHWAAAAECGPGSRPTSRSHPSLPSGPLPR
ncbi:LysR family transcriptional regulator [Streptomyces chrestomyceticus]|uniref:LysR family transcriptional regulator n=1 Tax=Streptomyces chrestomyceticus TaxID=68185 RepID=UPI0019D1B6CF|nr:LysR family transcriptional regulator [Streptomyces chrestomyceticus]